MDKALRIGFEAMPLHEEIKGRQGKSKTSLERRPSAMGHFLQMTDTVNHREDRLHQHARVPETTITQLEIQRIPFFGMEGRVTQDNPLLFIGRNQRRKGSIRRIGPGAIPPHHQTPLIEQQTKLAADNPAMVRFPFAPNLLPDREST